MAAPDSPSPAPGPSHMSLPLFWRFGSTGVGVLSAGLGPPGKQPDVLELIGNNRRQASSRAQKVQGQGSRRRETLAHCPWCLTVIGGDLPGLGGAGAAEVGSDWSGQWLSALCAGPLSPPGVRGERGIFTGTGVCVASTLERRSVHMFLKKTKNFTAQYENGAQHQTVRTKAKANLHLSPSPRPLCPHPDCHWPARLSPALDRGLVTGMCAEVPCLLALVS